MTQVTQKPSSMSFGNYNPVLGHCVGPDTVVGRDSEFIPSKKKYTFGDYNPVLGGCVGPDTEIGYPLQSAGQSTISKTAKFSFGAILLAALAFFGYKTHAEKQKQDGKTLATRVKGGATTVGSSLKSAAQAAKRFVKENPVATKIGIAAAAAGVGFLSYKMYPTKPVLTEETNPDYDAPSVGPKVPENNFQYGFNPDTQVAPHDDVVREQSRHADPELWQMIDKDVNDSMAKAAQNAANEPSMWEQIWGSKSSLPPVKDWRDEGFLKPILQAEHSAKVAEWMKLEEYVPYVDTPSVANENWLPPSMEVTDAAPSQEPNFDGSEWME